MIPCFSYSRPIHQNHALADSCRQRRIDWHQKKNRQLRDIDICRASNIILPKSKRMDLYVLCLKDIMLDIKSGKRNYHPALISTGLIAKEGAFALCGEMIDASSRF